MNESNFTEPPPVGLFRKVQNIYFKEKKNTQIEETRHIVISLALVK